MVRTSVMCGAVATLLWLARAPGLAHVAENYESVHFHSAQLDFGTVPRRGLVSGWEDCDRPNGGHAIDPVYTGDWTELSWEKDEREDEQQKKRLRGMYKRANRALKAGDLKDAVAIFTKMSAMRPKSGSLKDRTEVLRLAQGMSGRSKPSNADLRRYLFALPENDAERETAGSTELLRVYKSRTAGFLRGCALYQLACNDYQLRQYSDAISTLKRYLKLFPGHAKREAALIMLARAAILSNPPQSPSVGKSAVTQLLREYPHTRFRRAATGLSGRLHFVARDFRNALWCFVEAGDLESIEQTLSNTPDQSTGWARVRLMAGYLKRLARSNTHLSYDRSLHRISATRSRFTAQDAHNFSTLLMDHPELAAPYFYYRIYHGDFKPGRLRERKDLASLVTLAERIVKRHPETSLPSIVRLRFAEVYYQRRAYPQALRWVQTAMGVGDRALFVRGAIYEKMHRSREALADFKKIMSDYPNSPLRHGVREELAVVYERVGNLSEALNQYIALDYRPDIAFLLDARMSVQKVEKYARTVNPKLTVGFNDRYERWSEERKSRLIPIKDILAFTLGIRYLRLERWDDATKWFRAIPRPKYLMYCAGRRKWDDKASPDPLFAIWQMRALQDAARAAKTNEQSAAALYAYASYYYDHGNLLLYNPLLWQGYRTYGFGFWWNRQHATKEDELAAIGHMYEHEAYARALKLCLEVADRYPRTSAAPRALYRAATSAAHLDNLNMWWRDDEVERHDHVMQAANLMSSLAKRYPKHQLAAESRKFASVWATEAYTHAADRAQWRRDRSRNDEDDSGGGP